MDLRDIERAEWRKQRDFVEEILRHVPDGSKISFCKEFLERLLFDDIRSLNDVVYYNGEIVNLNKFTVDLPFKVPVWSGEFLKKLDLSEVSFEDVLWDSRCHIDVDSSVDQSICYSNTNARIDFSCAKRNRDGQVCLFGVDFSGTNLICFEAVDDMVQCSFSKCGLTKNDVHFSEQCVESCDFSYNNFFDMNVSCQDLDGMIENNSFIETKLHIDVPFCMLSDQVKKSFVKQVIQGRFYGCYCNGEFIYYAKRYGLWQGKRYIQKVLE